MLSLRLVDFVVQEVVDTDQNVIEFHRLIMLGATGIAEEKLKVLTEIASVQASLNSRHSEVRAWHFCF